MVNYIITQENIIPVDSKCSKPEHYLSKEDFGLLADDKEVRRELLNSLGKDKIIVSIGGYTQCQDGVYEKNDSQVIKVGEVKW